MKKYKSYNKRSSYKKKRFGKRSGSKKANGFKFKRNMLVTSTTRSIEVSIPVYVNSLGGTATQFGTWCALPSFAPGATSALLTCHMNLLANLNVASSSTFGCTAEFLRMRGAFQLCRLKAASISYNNNLASSNNIISTMSQLSFGLVPNTLSSITNDIVQLTNQYFYDGNTFIQPISYLPKYGSKFYKYPSRSINSSTAGALAPNEWMPCSSMSSSVLTLIMGVPTCDIAGGTVLAGSAPWATVAATASQTIVGQVKCKLFFEFASPTTSPAI